jgi:AcrR family transcriptional regulator
MVMASDRLTKQDWIKAGLKALLVSGADSLRAEALAKTLGVSRGSFYWHFAHVNAFHAAVLEEWERVATETVIKDVEAGGGSARDRLHRLCDIVFSTNGGLERHFRAWAAVNALAVEALERVDRQRMGYVRGLIASSVESLEVADALTRFFYLALVGKYAINEDFGLSPDELTMIIDRTLPIQTNGDTSAN